MSASIPDTAAATSAVGRLRAARAAGDRIALTPADRSSLTVAAWALRSGGVSATTIATVFCVPVTVVEKWLGDAGDAVAPVLVRRTWKAWARDRLAEADTQKAAPDPSPARVSAATSVPPRVKRAQAGAEAVVVADHVTKTWGSTRALSGVTLAIGSGVTGLLGANGAGKTTLLGMILGLHKPDSGSLRVLGLDPVHAGTDIRERIGYSPEHEALPGDVKAHDFVRHMAEVHGIPHRAAVARSSDALYLVGLGEERFRPIGTMSTGQKQRVKLAQAIVHDPALVLLDEPTNGLDPVQRDEMLSLIHDIGHDLGLNVVLCSHLLEEVERVCDSAIILESGAVRASGTMHELRGEGGELLVVIDGDSDALVKALARIGARAEGPRVLVPFTGDQVYDVVRDAAAKLGTPIRRFGRREATLEDVFLGVGS